MIRYNNRVTLMSATRQTFSGGWFTVTQNTVNTYWANVSGVGGESYDEIKGQQLDKIKIIMRNFLTLDKAVNTFYFDGQDMHIESINDETNKGREMQIICRVRRDT